jgi:hypothetical protein
MIYMYTCVIMPMPNTGVKCPELGVLHGDLCRDKFKAPADYIFFFFFFFLTVTSVCSGAISEEAYLLSLELATQSAITGVIL